MKMTRKKSRWQVHPNQPQQPVQRAQVQPDQEVQGDRLLDRVVGQVQNQEQTLQEQAMPEQPFQEQISQEQTLQEHAMPEQEVRRGKKDKY